MDIDVRSPGVLFVAVIAALIPVGLWVLLASSRFIHGGDVERPDRVPQLYGYTVCLIALLWALTSVVSLIDHVFVLSAPAYHMQNQFGPEPSVTSFEAFRMTYDRGRRPGAPGAESKSDTLPEAEMRRRYETLRADRITATVVTTQQAVVTQLVSLVIAVGLLVFHWRWLRGRASHIAG